LKDTNLKVHSIFYSIQGEGPLSGVPSVFLRLSGCNLKCVFCDSTEALKKGKTMEIKEVIHHILSLKHKASNLVITGGEPLLQKESLSVLLYEIKKAFSTIEVETNGTISPISFTWVRYNVSPKTGNSGMSVLQVYKPETLKEFLPFDSIYKFVVSEEEDLKEILEIVNNLSIPLHRVYLMPMASNPQELKIRAPEVVRLSLKYGFRYSDRLHLRLHIS